MESKLHENLYFAGEIVNIDAITGDLISKMPGQVAYTS
jgi:predicted flavoprotein YhiN